MLVTCKNKLIGALLLSLHGALARSLVATGHEMNQHDPEAGETTAPTHAHNMLFHNVSSPIFKSVTHHEIEKALDGFLLTLRNLSETGIYNSLSVRGTTAAEKFRGNFHEVLRLRVTLASPLLASDAPSDVAILVLTSRREDSGVSRHHPCRTIYAIEEFPQMDGDAVDTFQSWRAAERRARREDVWRQYRGRMS